MAATSWYCVRIELACDRTAAHLAADLVRLLCEGAGLEQERASEVELALVEAVNNAVEHANRFDRSKHVLLSLEHTPTALVLRISDDGQPMSRERFDAAAPTMEHVTHCEIDALPQRGMGLSIMKMAMDDVSYETSGGWNVLTMKKRLVGRHEAVEAVS